MLINLSSSILKLDDTEFDDKLTLQAVIILALTTIIRSDESTKIEHKIKLYKLAQKISQSAEVDLTAEDIVLIKDRIAATIQNVVVIGRAFDLLEV